MSLKKITEDDVNAIQQMIAAKKTNPADILSGLKKFTIEDISKLLTLITSERMQALFSLQKGTCKMVAGENS